jgi:hypothetical protein
MKNELVVLAAVLLAGPFAVAQNIEGQIIASQYGEWKVQGYSPDSYTFAPTACRVQGGASFFPAFTVGTPIRIVDGSPKLSETVIPSSFLYNNTTCSISISPVNHHQLPFYLASATGGLQEAINANVSNPGTNTIILNNKWYQLGGSPSVISSVKGTAQLGLIDVTTIPSTWYQWNGAQYVVVPVGSDVLSVFGRTGNVTAQAGDYTCDMVTNCWSGPNPGFTAGLTSAMTPTSTSFTVTGLAGNPGSEGYLFIDSEWMHYTGYSGGRFTVGPDQFGCSGRGCFLDTPASHGANAAVFGAILVAANPSQAPNLVIAGSPFAGGDVVGLENSHPGGDGIVSIWLGTNAYIGTDGGYHQNNSSVNGISGPLYIGSNGVPPHSTFGFLPISNSTNVIQSSIAGEIRQPFGFASGISGNIEAVQPATVGVPVLTSEFIGSGSCSVTYEIAGTDTDGNAVPGTTATISGLATAPWPFPGTIHIQGQPAAGIETFHAYRVSSSGCGSLSTGQWTAPISNTNYPYFQDSGATADGSAPSGTNESVPKVCTNGEQFCMLSGATSTPPLICGAGQEGWEYHDVARNPPYHLYRCETGSWTGIN